MSKPAEFDSQGRLILGPTGVTPSRAKLQITPDADDAAGVGITLYPSPTTDNERAGIRIGSWLLVQDSAIDGTLDLALTQADGTLVTRLTNDTGSANTHDRHLHRSFVPFGLAPTGTMADDGAVTFGTAFPGTGIPYGWIWFPPGALWAQDLVGPPIVAGDSAGGFYWCVFSAADTATVYKDTWDGGAAPTVPSAPVAIVSLVDGAGPGAFTGVTVAATYVTFSLPGFRANDSLSFELDILSTDNANVKTATATWAGTDVLTYTLTSLGKAKATGRIANAGDANNQVVSGILYGDATVLVLNSTYETEADEVGDGPEVGFTLARANATDAVLVTGMRVSQDM